MKEWTKYGVTSLITALMMLMALYALSRGYQQMNGGVPDDSSSIFKPFSSLFGKDKGEPDLPQKIDSPKEEHQKEEQKKESDPKEKIIVPKDLTITESDLKKSKKESHPGLESKNTETSSTFILIGKTKNERGFSKESERQIVIPSFDSIFIPVYSAENFTDRALKQFQGIFASADPQTKLFVIEREVAGTGYEISVYEEKDRQFLGVFTTNEDASFPFRGLPRFLKVEGNQFESSSRFLVIEDTSENTNAVLNTESHLETLLKSVYRQNFDPQMLIGKDPQFGLEIYTLFPGIFIAHNLR